MKLVKGRTKASFTHTSCVKDSWEVMDENVSLMGIDKVCKKNVILENQDKKVDDGVKWNEEVRDLENALENKFNGGGGTSQNKENLGDQNGQNSCHGSDSGSFMVHMNDDDTSLGKGTRRSGGNGDIENDAYQMFNKKNDEKSDEKSGGSETRDGKSVEFVRFDGKREEVESLDENGEEEDCSIKEIESNGVTDITGGWMGVGELCKEDGKGKQIELSGVVTNSFGLKVLGEICKEDVEVKGIQSKNSKEDDKNKKCLPIYNDIGEGGDESKGSEYLSFEEEYDGWFENQIEAPKVSGYNLDKLKMDNGYVMCGNRRMSKVAWKPLVKMRMNGGIMGENSGDADYVVIGINDLVVGIDGNIADNLRIKEKGKDKDMESSGLMHNRVMSCDDGTNVSLSMNGNSVCVGMDDELVEECLSCMQMEADKPLVEKFKKKLRLIQMARRVSDYRIRRIADRGNEEDGPDSRAREDRFYHNRRSADRGNEKVDRDPGNISEIKGLWRRNGNGEAVEFIVCLATFKSEEILVKSDWKKPRSVVQLCTFPWNTYELDHFEATVHEFSLVNVCWLLRSTQVLVRKCAKESGVSIVYWKFDIGKWPRRKKTRVMFDIWKWPNRKKKDVLIGI
nr:wall-associated kinase family protein [Tanacetum cinerariifolium]